MADRERLVHDLDLELAKLTRAQGDFSDGDMARPHMSRALGLALRLLADLGYDFTATRLRGPSSRPPA